MEELQSALANHCLTVSNLPEKGRCLLTTKDFSPGEAILSQEPYVSVPNNSAADSKCDACFESSHLKKCSRCHVVFYCSAACQKSEWKLHRLECRALSELPKEKRRAVTPSLRLMIRLYCRSKLQSQKVIPTSATDKYGLVEALVSHMSEVDEKKIVLYAQMANLISMILKRPDISIKEIAENFSKFACNAHTICDSELKPLGTGLYPVISIINHSCSPNAVLLFEGRTSIVRAVQHIPKGSEVLISYIDTAGSTTTRQKALKEQYLFTCACSRCIKAVDYEDIKESAILEGYRCSDSKCDGFLLRDSDEKGFICQKCGRLKKKEDIIKMESEIEPLKEKARRDVESASSITYPEVIALMKPLETLQRKLYHDFCVYLLSTWEGFIQNLMRLEEWGEALSYCRLTIPVYQRAYPGFHPSLGLQYYTCGKLEWLLGETDAAVISFTKAVDILRITHGTSTPFMKDLFRKLEEARAEAFIHKGD